MTEMPLNDVVKIFWPAIIIVKFKSLKMPFVIEKYVKCYYLLLGIFFC